MSRNTGLVNLDRDGHQNHVVGLMNANLVDDGHRDHADQRARADCSEVIVVPSDLQR